jgi:hypothetical protein
VQSKRFGELAIAAGEMGRQRAIAARCPSLF